MTVKLRLSAMMFGQYFVWGAWWVTLGTYMNAIGLDEVIGTTYSVQGWAALATPLALGVIADRYFEASRLFALLHIAGAALLLWLANVTEPTIFFFVALGYMLCYMPTLPLSNTIAFNALGNVQREFPAIRVLGTIGWIAAGLAIGFFAIEATRIPILIAASASLLLGLYGFTLPRAAKTERQAATSVPEYLGLDIFSAVRDRAFWIFIAASLLICIPLAFYYAYTNLFLVEKGVEGAAAVQSLGQMSEVVFLLLLPFFLARFGIKMVLIVGMFAWAIRYVAFSQGFVGDDPVMALLIFGILLHGICYDFFFVAGQIYVDGKVAPAMRARAQSFLALVTLGLGTVIGSNLANTVFVRNTVAGGAHDWESIWLIPAALSAIVAVVFALLFRERRTATATERASAGAPATKI